MHIQFLTFQTKVDILVSILLFSDKYFPTQFNWFECPCMRAVFNKNMQCMRQQLPLRNASWDALSFVSNEIATAPLFFSPETDPTTPEVARVLAGFNWRISFHKVLHIHFVPPAKKSTLFEGAKERGLVSL
jgi:hypothetical protein